MPCLLLLTAGHQSTGELENDKKVADAVYSMLLSSQRIVSSVKNDAFRRLSSTLPLLSRIVAHPTLVVMADYQLVVSISDSKVYIAKRPVSA